MNPVVALIPLFAYSVVDGATLRQGAADYRLWGITVPGLHAQGGAEAQAALADLLRGQPLTCQVQRDAASGPDIPAVRCFPRDGTDIACEMVRLGHARPVSGGHYEDCLRE